MFGIIVGISLIASVAGAEPPSTPLFAPRIDQDASLPQEMIYPTSALEYPNNIVLEMASKYGVSYHEMATTIECESSWNPEAVGDGGDSRGLAQIHAPSHPTITDEMAFDPKWSIEWMAKEFSKGNQWMWTCWRDKFK